MSKFRNIIANGDLIRERKAPCWWLFGEEKWQPYRNISREVRYLEERMHKLHSLYKEAQEDYVVAQKNMVLDMELLKAFKTKNSEAVYELPSDESILARREGVKYNANNSAQKQKEQSGKENNQQNSGSEKSEGQDQSQNQNNSNKQKQKSTPKTLLEFLAGSRIILPT